MEMGGRQKEKLILFQYNTSIKIMKISNLKNNN